MPRVACPHCRHQTPITDEQRGTTVPCGQCQRPLKIPAAKAATSPPPAQAVTPALTLPPATRRPAPAEDEPPPDDADEADETQAAAGGGGGFGILGGIGALLVLAVFILVISGKWVDLIWHPLQRTLEEQDIPPLLAIGLTAVIFLVPMSLLSASNTRTTILGAMPDELDFRTARAADFPGLDTEGLEEYTQALEGLGFRQLTDYTPLTELANFPRGFGRLFVHPEEHCFAEINQAFASGQRVPLRCCVMSFLDDGWSVATTDRVATKHNYLMRRPRAAWRSLPGERPAGLVKAHLKLRRQMTADLGVEVVEEGTAGAYFEREREANRQRKQAVRQRSGLGILLDHWLFDRNPKTEWLGEYAGKRR
jgi:hypothetical protein